MNPLTAFGVAVNFIQLVDFGCNLLSDTVTLYQSATGTTLENIELEIITKDIQKMIEPLCTSRKGSGLSSTYLALLDSCDDVARDLLSAVEKLKVQVAAHKKWRSFGKALRTVWKKEEISRLRARLEKLREQIVVHVIRESGDRLRYVQLTGHASL